MDVKKCNITAIALDNLNELYWAIPKKKNDDISLIGNYINFLNCPTIKLDECGDSNCINIPIVVNCQFKVNNIVKTSSLQSDTFDIGFYVGGYLNGLQPYTYIWSYDTTKFTLASVDITSPTLLLNVIGNIDPNLVVSSIHVAVTDSNGCISSKTCYITPNGMQCGTAYRNCPSPKSLVVRGEYRTCPSPKSLVVH